MTESLIFEPDHVKEHFDITWEVFQFKNDKNSTENLPFFAIIFSNGQIYRSFLPDYDLPNVSAEKWYEII